MRRKKPRRRTIEAKVKILDVELFKKELKVLNEAFESKLVATYEDVGGGTAKVRVTVK